MTLDELWEQCAKELDQANANHDFIEEVLLRRETDGGDDATS